MDIVISSTIQTMGHACRGRRLVVNQLGLSGRLDCRTSIGRAPHATHPRRGGTDELGQISIILQEREGCSLEFSGQPQVNQRMPHIVGVSQLAGPPILRPYKLRQALLSFFRADKKRAGPGFGGEPLHHRSVEGLGNVVRGRKQRAQRAPDFFRLITFKPWTAASSVRAAAAPAPLPSSRERDGPSPGSGCDQETAGQRTAHRPRPALVETPSAGRAKAGPKSSPRSTQCTYRNKPSLRSRMRLTFSGETSVSPKSRLSSLTR